MDDISGGYWTGYRQAMDGVPEHEVECACCHETFRCARVPYVGWICDQCADDNRDDDGGDR